MNSSISSVIDSKRPTLPFILNFLEHRDGAMAATTSGPVNQIDACDAD